MSDGTYYVGGFKKGKREGEGKEFDKDEKEIAAGTWKKGKLQS